MGGVAALIQLSESGGWFVRGLYRFSKDAGAAGVEVKRFGHQARSSSNSIEVALINTLDRYCARHPTSTVVVYISTNHVLTLHQHKGKTGPGSHGIHHQPGLFHKVKHHLQTMARLSRQISRGRHLTRRH